MPKSSGCLSGVATSLLTALPVADSCRELLPEKIWVMASPCTRNAGIRGLHYLFVQDVNACVNLGIVASLVAPSDSLGAHPSDCQSSSMEAMG